MKYNIILFDADGTLLDFDKDERISINRVLSDLNIDSAIELNTIADSFSEINKDIWKEYEKKLISLDELRVQRFIRLCSKFTLNVDPYELSSKFMSYLYDGGVVYDGVYQLLLKLKSSYKLVLVTNGVSEVQHNRFLNADIEKYFTEIIISDEIGFSKPERKIFEYALNKIGCKSLEKVLMVGDSITSDIKGANLLNIDSCWLNRNSLKNETKYVPTYEIKNITELFEIL